MNYDNIRTQKFHQLRGVERASSGVSHATVLKGCFRGGLDRDLVAVLVNLVHEELKRWIGWLQSLINC